MLHPTLLRELLDDEVAVAVDRLGDRVDQLTHDGRYVSCLLPAPDGSAVWLRLDAACYDGDPVRVDVVDQAGKPVLMTLWPAGLSSGEHPVTKHSFVCMQGVHEYYTHPSHHKERWDGHRATLRIPDILDHLLRRAGR